MISLILSATAVFVLLALAWYGFARRSSPGDVSLGCVALLLAGEAAERFALVTAASPLSVWRIASLIESLLPAALLWYGFTFARRDRLQLLSAKGLVPALAAVVIPAWTALAPVDAFFYAPDIQSEGMLFLNAAGYWFYLLLLLACIAALMNLESTFASSRGCDRSKITYEVTGMGSMLAVLIFYFLVQKGLDSAGATGRIIVETGLHDELIFVKESDNGPGMSREFMQYQLFRPFRSTKQAVLGIGLYQCRQMVEAWGGTIEAASDEGKGAIFAVRLPARVRSLVSVA